MKTRAQRIAALVRIYAEIPPDQLYDAIQNDVKALKSKLSAKPPVRSSDEIQKFIPGKHLKMLFDCIPEIFKGNTEIIMSMLLQLLLDASVRIDEACNISIKNIDLAERLIYLNKTKGQKPRTVAISEAFAGLLAVYVKMLPQSQRFLFEKRKGSHPTGKYTTAAFQKNLRKLREFAGEKYNEDLSYVKCHAFRHTSLQQLAAGGANIEFIQGQAGHSNPATTANSYILNNSALLRSKLDEARQKLGGQ
jgi:integrase